MPIDSTHPKYKKYASQWIRCRDVVEGSDAVKGKKELYLPKLTDSTKSEYDAYLRRALFFSVAGRSLQGLVGSMTRRTPTITKTTEMDPFFEDVSLNNVSFVEIFNDAANELLTVGRYGMLADVPVDGGRSYIAIYKSESIINWSIDRFTGELLWVMLMERIYVPDPQDQFELIPSVQFRHLRMVLGIYNVDLYDADLKFISNTIPTVRGNTMDVIPFVSVNSFGISIEPHKPPILDIVDVNLSQYMTSADLENGRHFVALPTPIVTGAEADKTLKVGGNTAWVISNDKAKVYYLEFLGEGLKSLEHAMSEKTGQMAQFSARLMDTSSRGSEAEGTVRLRHSADAATLNSVAISLEAGFNLVFKYLAAFEGTDEPTIELSKDFLDTKLSHQELKELTISFLEGAIDEDVYFYNLERGELIPVDKTQMDFARLRKKDSAETDTDDNSNSGDQD